MRLLVALAVASLPLVASAQSDSTRDRAGMDSREIWAGFSNRSPKWGVLGNRPGMSFGIASARFSHRIRATPRYALDYTVDIVPFAISSPSVDYVILDPNGNPVSEAPRGECNESAFRCRFPKGSPRGLGASPVGFTAVYRRESLFQPRLGFAGGFLVFDKKVPTVISTEFNFTASIEGGVQVLNRSGNGILLVYRFHHLSNAGMGEDNSALASHVISIGGRWRARSR